MVSQFVSSHKKRLLCHLNYNFPEGTMAVGRLDDNSEGLLILTTDKRLPNLLLSPEKKHARTYLLQLEKIVSEESLNRFRNGLVIKTHGGDDYKTMPCLAKVVQRPQNLPPRRHEFRADLPQTWLEVTLYEGKFHQLRKMASAIGHDCKRIIRLSIEDLNLGNMQPEEVVEMDEKTIFELLKLN